MPGAQAAVDSQILKDLLDAEQFCRLLGAAGQRVEFWEAYALSKSEPALVAGEISRLSGLVRNRRPAEAGSAVLEKLRFIRSDMGQLVHHLRQFLGVLPEPVNSSRLNLLVVFIMSSLQGREAAARWVADPVSRREEAAIRVQVMSGLVDTYRRALMEAHVAAAPAETPPAAEAPAGPEEAPAEPPPPGPDPVVGALRLAGRCREALKGANFKPEIWELLFLAVNDAPGLRAAVGELEGLKAHGKPGEFAGAAYAFRQTVGRVREQHGERVNRLHAYAAGLNLSGWDGDTEGIVLGMLLVSPQGQARVERWLKRPRESLRESANFLGTLITRSLRCLKALREGTDGKSNLPAG